MKISNLFRTKYIVTFYESKGYEWVEVTAKRFGFEVCIDAETFKGIKHQVEHEKGISRWLK